MTTNVETIEAVGSVPTGNVGRELFDDAGAAAYVGGIEERTVRDWRTRRGLPFLRLTAKTIRIRRADLDRWLARHQVSITRGAE